MTFQAVIEDATGDAIKSGYTDFTAELQAGQSIRTDSPIPCFTRHGNPNLNLMHRWTGAAWISVAQPPLLPLPPTTIGSGLIIGASAIFTTPVISSDQDDYVIADLNNYTLLVFQSSNNIDITGIDSSSLSEYQLFAVLNGNTNGKRVKFKKNDGDSLPANRFFMKDDIDLEEGNLWWFVYNISQQRWNSLAKL